jgi:hypothetical protein
MWGTLFRGESSREFGFALRQGLGANAGLVLALVAGFAAGFFVGANAGFTAGAAAFGAAAGRGSFAGGWLAALSSVGFSSSPGNCSSSLPTMAARMKLIQMGSAVTAPVSFSPSDSRLS